MVMCLTSRNGDFVCIITCNLLNILMCGENSVVIFPKVTLLKQQHTKFKEKSHWKRDLKGPIQLCPNLT